jgi:hypothetical protein
MEVKCPRICCKQKQENDSIIVATFKCRRSDEDQEEVQYVLESLKDHDVLNNDSRCHGRTESVCHDATGSICHNATDSAYHNAIDIKTKVQT